MLLPYSLFTAILYLWSLLPTPGHGAFTIAVTSGNDTSVIEQNDAGTWCFYPAPRDERTIQPEESCTGLKADFSAVMKAHLQETASIGYYSASFERLGGPEFIVQAHVGKLYLCVSGRATDGLYETSCEESTRDNQFGVGPFGNRTVCQVEEAQETVTDGCYAPGLAEVTPANNSASGGYVRKGLWLIPAAIYTLLPHL